MVHFPSSGIENSKVLTIKEYFELETPKYYQLSAGNTLEAGEAPKCGKRHNYLKIGTLGAHWFVCIIRVIIIRC
jgi:hypothetical protein